MSKGASLIRRTSKSRVRKFTSHHSSTTETLNGEIAKSLRISKSISRTPNSVLSESRRTYRSYIADGKSRIDENSSRYQRRSKIYHGRARLLSPSSVTHALEAVRTKRRILVVRSFDASETTVGHDRTPYIPTLASPSFLQKRRNTTDASRTDVHRRRNR